MLDASGKDFTNWVTWRDEKLIQAGGFVGALLWLASGCSGTPVGGCSKEGDCGPGEYCALGVCRRPLGTTGTASASASSTTTSAGGVTGSATGAATSSGGVFGTTGGIFGTTGSSTGPGTSSGGGTGTTGGSGTGTTGGSSSGTGGGDPYCTTCTQDNQCGGGQNLCITFDGTTYFCGIDCSQTDMCSEAGAACDEIDDGMGDPVGYNCAPNSGVCGVIDDYCLPCTQNSDCGGGANLCIAPDGFDYFCATDCSQTGSCTEAGADCEEYDDPNTGMYVGEVCEPDSGLCND